MSQAGECRPNLVFFFTDQQRWDTVGAYGSLGRELNLTPNLDQMATEGVRFEHAFTCQPVCGPARSCLQTGKYATETDCFRNDIALPTDERTIAHWFAEAGYEVAYIGKWHLASTGPEENFRTKPVPPERRGGWKDYWLASDVLEFTSHSYEGHLFDAEGNQVKFEGYRADCLTDFALDWLRQRDSDRPFFLFVSFLEPHQQNDHNRFEGPTGSKQKYADFSVPGDLAGLEGDWPQQLPDYLGCCASLDYNLGRVRHTLQELGLADDTLVIYSADHGCHFRTRNSEYKRSCHDSSLRVPLIACGPGFRGGQTVSELVSLIDLPPTFMTAAGLEIPPTFQGRPLQELIEGNAPDWPQEIFAQISETQVGRCIRTHEWKYSVSARFEEEGAGGKYPAADIYYEQFLYDLAEDPYERNNLVSDPHYGEVRAELRETLKRRLAKAGEEVPEILPAARGGSVVRNVEM